MKMTMKQLEKLNSMKQREIQREHGHIQDLLDQIFDFLSWAADDLDFLEKELGKKFPDKKQIKRHVGDIFAELEETGKDIADLESSLESIEVVESL